MDVNMEIAGSSSLEEPDVFNEGIREEHEMKTEDELKVENIGPLHPSQVREGGHPLCVAADQGQMVMPTPKGAIPYTALAQRKADERLMLALIRLALIRLASIKLFCDIRQIKKPTLTLFKEWADDQCDALQANRHDSLVKHEKLITKTESTGVSVRQSTVNNAVFQEHEYEEDGFSSGYEELEIEWLSYGGNISTGSTVTTVMFIRDPESTESIFAYCISCNDASHRALQCKDFIDMPVVQRHGIVRKMGACRRCLKDLRYLSDSFDDTVFELTSARVDNLSDGVGPTTRCRLCILQENDADEVRRLVQQEAIYSAAQDQIADEEKLAASQL
jgi:hypothetical protein